MKYLFLILLLCYSSFGEELQLKILRPKTKKALVKTKALSIHRSSPLDSVLSRLESQNKQINDGLGIYHDKPAVWDFTNQFDFKTGTVFKGILLNSIVSTNLESPILVLVKNAQGLPSGSKFSCTGVTKYKRVVSACNRLILPDETQEFEVKTSLLNTDGSSGLKADYVYTGKEEFVAASIATSFAKGVIEVEAERLATPLGELTTNRAKNRILNGALSSTDDINNMMRTEMQNREPKVYIESGKEVLIYFHERFKR